MRILNGENKSHFENLLDKNKRDNNPPKKFTSINS